MYNINRIKKEIEQEINKNNNEIENLKNKIRIIRNNTFQIKIIRVLSMAILTGSLLFIPTAFLARINLIPYDLLQVFNILISANIGFIGEKIITKKLKLNEKLKQFSKSHTNDEKIEEENRYKMKVKQLESINQVLTQTIKKLEEKAKKIKEISKEYTIVNNDHRTLSEIEESINKNNRSYTDTKEAIIKYSNKVALQQNLNIARDKVNDIQNVLVYPMFGALLIMIFYNIPLLGNYSVGFNALRFIIPNIAGYIGSLSCILKVSRDSKKAFKKINSELNEDSLKEKIWDLSDEQYEEELSILINQASNILVKLEEEKIKLCALKENSKDEYSKNNQSFNNNLNLVSSPIQSEPHVLRKLKKRK